MTKQIVADIAASQIRSEYAKHKVRIAEKSNTKNATIPKEMINKELAINFFITCFLSTLPPLFDKVKR